MTEQATKIIAPDWDKQFSFISVDDIMNSIEISQERAAFALEELLEDFHAVEWNDRLERKFKTQYDRYRILLDLAYSNTDEILDHLHRWQEIERPTKDDGKAKTYKERINRMLDNIDESSDEGKATLKKFIEVINRLIVGYEVFEYRMKGTK